MGHDLDEGTSEEGMESEEDESEIDEVSVMMEVMDDPEGESEEEENLNLMGVDNSTLGEQGAKEWATWLLWTTVRVIIRLRQRFWEEC